MYKYAVINKEKIIIGIIETETQQNNSDKIEFSEPVEIGQKYENGQWVEIPQDPEPETISAYDFYRRFPIEIKIAIEDSTDTAAKVFRQDLQAAIANQRRFEKDNAELNAGMDYMVTTGVITEKQKIEIMDF